MLARSKARISIFSFPVSFFTDSTILVALEGFLHAIGMIQDNKKKREIPRGSKDSRRISGCTDGNLRLAHAGKLSDCL